MKRKLLLNLFMTFVFFGFIAQETHAQLNISTEKRLTAYWDDDDEEWVLLTEKEDNTLFHFNESMTMFTHTTATISSTYYIKSKEYDGSAQRYDMSIVSDVGNKYTMVIDVKNSNLRFIYTKGDMTYAVQHNIKNAWTDDDE